MTMSPVSTNARRREERKPRSTRTRHCAANATRNAKRYSIFHSLFAMLLGFQEINYIIGLVLQRKLERELVYGGVAPDEGDEGQEEVEELVEPIAGTFSQLWFRQLECSSYTLCCVFFFFFSSIDLISVWTNFSLNTCRRRT